MIEHLFMEEAIKEFWSFNNQQYITRWDKTMMMQISSSNTHLWVFVLIYGKREKKLTVNEQEERICWMICPEYRIAFLGSLVGLESTAVESISEIKLL